MILQMAMVWVVGATAPKGLVVASPLEEVQQLDARLPDLVQPGARLSAMLATKAEIKKSVLAMGASPTDIDTIVRSTLDQQNPAADLPALFASRAAIVEKASHGTHSIRFYDKGGKRLELSVLERDDKSLALMTAPTAEAADLDDDTEWLHADRARNPGPQPLFFIKEAGTWAAAPLPAPSPAHCLEGMHEAARAILASQQKYFAANNKYSKSFGKLDYDGASFFSTSSSITSADATHFSAEVHRFGGVVKVTETKKLVDVTPCKLTP